MSIFFWQGTLVKLRAIEPSDWSIILTGTKIARYSIGRLRRIIYAQGQFFDELFYGMTAEEFREKFTDRYIPFEQS